MATRKQSSRKKKDLAEEQPTVLILHTGNEFGDSESLKEGACVALYDEEEYDEEEGGGKEASPVRVYSLTDPADLRELADYLEERQEQEAASAVRKPSGEKSGSRRRAGS